MLKQDAPRQVVQGIHVLRLKTGPYIEVAERVRLVHKAGKSFSFERGEVLSIHGRWIYRAYIVVDEQCYIGDAEIHFSAPLNTPDGTNPITCGQTSAIGNALTFAGFGDLKTVLARLGQSLEGEREIPLDEGHQMIQDVEVVMLNDEPYVTVAERIYFVHLTKKAFSIEQCKLIRYNNVWIYRASITVDGQRYIGDAEVYFDAPHDPDRTYPISCGQTSAIGNALAFAGFGDVASLLERSGKESETSKGKPMLASANAVIRARQQEKAVGKQEMMVLSDSAQNGHGAENQRGRSSQGINNERNVNISSPQRASIRVLCERLGESEPDYTTMTNEDADLRIAQLRRSEEELLLTADDVIQQESFQRADQPLADTLVSNEAVRILKEAWLQAFQVTGAIAIKREKWAKFKFDTCTLDVDDDAMRYVHHDQLHAAIVAEEERRVAHASTKHTAEIPLTHEMAH